jgi:hypothetical protein
VPVVQIGLKFRQALGKGWVFIGEGDFYFYGRVVF